MLRASLSPFEVPFTSRMLAPNARMCWMAACSCVLSTLPGAFAEVLTKKPHHGETTASNVRSGLVAAGVGNFLILPEHKLMLCTIHRVGRSMFQDLFRFARSTTDQEQFAHHNLTFANSPAHHNLTFADLDRMMLDKEWHKAIFFRDPLERFASAFNSKCVPGHADSDGPTVCAAQFGAANVSWLSAVLKVADYDAAHSFQGRAEDFNINFRPMAHFCGGLGRTLRHYNTVEMLSSDGSTRKKVVAMLKSVNVSVRKIPGFEKLFVKGTTAGSAKAMPSLGNRSKSIPNARSWPHSRSTGTAEHMEQFYPKQETWVANTIVRHFWNDYRIFRPYGLKLPIEVANKTQDKDAGLLSTMLNRLRIQRRKFRKSFKAQRRTLRHITFQ